MGYPVVVETPLSPARRRFLIGGRREASELPELPSGAIYLFKVNGRYQPYGDDRHLDLADAMVVDAVAVSVVQMRVSIVSADIAIPSTSASDDFTVRSSFRCRVTRPETVARAGYANLAALLANHLRQDRDLASLGERYRIDDVNQVRHHVDAQITAYCTLEPPEVEGMEIELENVAVLTPADLRDQGRRMRDEEWGQDLGRLKRAFENEDVRRLAEIMERGPVYADALGVSRDQVSLAQVADRAYEADQERRKQLSEVVQSMVDRGFFDRVPLDPVSLMNAVTGGAAGIAATDALTASAKPAAVSDRSARGDADADDDDEPDFIPNEESDD